MTGTFGRTTTWRGAALVATALAIAACGGDGDDDSQAGQSPSPGGNQAPTIGGNPPSQILVGSSFNFTPSSADADGDSLSFTIQNRPAWATFDSNTGRLSGTPGDGDLGTYSGIRISVSDGEATVNLTAFNINVVASGNGAATLSWTAPTQKTDGTPVDLAGYKIYWGTSSRNYANSQSLNTPGVATYVIDGLTPATWYFAVTAVDSQGLESDYSNEATKQIM